MRGDDSLRWFRLYSDIVDNHKIRMLSPDIRWYYVGVMACECQGILHGDDIDYIEKVLAIKLEVYNPEKLKQIKADLLEARLIDETWQPTGWDERQFKSDSSKDRVAKHRAKKKETLQKRYTDVTVTPPEQKRTEKKQNKKEYKELEPELLELGIDKELFSEYILTRKRKGATNSERALKQLIKKIRTFAEEGANANDILEEANAQGWKTVYWRKEDNGASKSAIKISKHTNW